MASQQAECIADDKVGNIRTGTFTLTDGTTHLATIANAVATDYADVTNFSHFTVVLDNSAGGTTTTTFQGSMNGTTWFTIAARVDSATAYVATAVSIVGAGSAIRHFSPDDNLRYIRLNVSAVGTAPTARLYARAG